MDFLNKSYNQIADLFRTMTPSARITTALLLAVVVVSLTLLFRGQSETADEYLFGAEPLTNREITAIQNAFAAKGLNDWNNDGNRIKVPRNQRHLYLAAVGEGEALPAAAGSAWDEMFKETNAFESRQMREYRAMRAMEKDLAVSLRLMEDVEYADVKISEVAGKSFARDKVRRVAVTLWGLGNRELPAAKLKMMHEFVSHSVGSETVMVADANGDRIYKGATEDGFSAHDDLYAQARERHEQEYLQKISSQLSHIPGAKVSVSVELDKNISSTTTTHNVTEGAPIELIEDTEDVSTKPAEQGSRPGAEPNIGNTARSIANAGTEATESRSSTTRRNALGVEQSHVKVTGLTPKRVTAAIGIPMSYYKTVWLRQNPTAPGETATDPTKSELTAVQDRVETELEMAIAVLLPPPPPGGNSDPLVQVTPYVDLEKPEPQPPGMIDTVFSWLSGNWQSLGMFGVAIMGVFVLRGMVQAATPPNVPIPNEAAAATASTAGGAAAEDDEDEDFDVGNSLRARFQSTGRSLRDELAEVVREDPDAAASVLKNWISDAA